MKKKPLAITISTIFTVLVCLFAAVVLWLYVQFSDGADPEALMRLGDAIGALL